MARSVKWWIIAISVFTLSFLPPTKGNNIIQRYFKCPKDYMALGRVCGSDGVTYENLCELEYARSKNQTDLEVRYLGKCKVKKDRKCGHWDPVCGNDFITYNNKCQFQRAHAKRPGLKIVHMGECWLRIIRNY
ncbi:kazal-type serine protease inhibitor domain-containing protein [Phthorimaea operculella]|nr:kazal-type serine protease inhibitor domain-containing protein [Phthorimaea operculella]